MGSQRPKKVQDVLQIRDFDICGEVHVQTTRFRTSKKMKTNIFFTPKASSIRPQFISTCN